MSSPARFVRRSLTAVLVSMAIAWAPTAFSAPDAVGGGNSISLSPSEGPPSTPVHVGFQSCASEYGSIVQLTWGGSPVHFTPAGAGSADFTVPDGAAPDSYPVTAQCSNGAVGPGSGSFTVTTPDGGDGDGETPVYNAELSLEPTQGASETTVTATGSGFNCSYVDVVWDVQGDPTTLSGTGVSTEGTFTTEFDVPADSSETTYTVRAECTKDPHTSDDADFVVTSTATDGTDTGGGNTGGTDGGTTGGTDGGTTGETDGGTTGGTDGGTTGGTDGGTTGGTDNGTTGATDDGSIGGTDHGGTATPIGLVVGPSAFGAVVLLAALFALLNHRHRGPRWVRDHVRATLRPGSGRADLHEQRDGGSANRTVRLEPHTDPGDQNLDRGEP